jgi:acetyl esterase/lipase
VTGVRRALAVVVAAAVMVAAAGCGGDSDPVRPPVELGVTFAPGLLADVYRPIRGPGPLRAVVVVHGGGFVGGSRGDLGAFSEALARLGYLAVTVDYTLSTGNWFPATTLTQPGLPDAVTRAAADVEKAVAWLGTDAASFHVDSAHIAVVGYSAGAITALAVAAQPDAHVDGAVAISGAAVDPDALARSHPPLLLLTGDQDNVIPADLADETCAAATQGGPCNVFHYGDQGHDLPTSAAAPDVIGRVDRFLRQA